MKKLVCLIMALMLLAVCTACSGSNGDYSKYGKSAVLELGSSTAKPGSTVELDVSLNNNPGTSTIGIELSYDTAVLTPVSIERTGTLKGLGFFTSNLEGGDEYGAFSGDDGSTVQGIWFNTSDFKDNGKVMTVKFEVADDAPAGEYAVKFIPSDDDLTNEKLEQVDVVYLDGTVTVK